MCVDDGKAAGAQSIFRSLQSEKQLVEQSVEQLYSEAAGKFLADRYVSGTCPKCSYEVRGFKSCAAIGFTLARRPLFCSLFVFKLYFAFRNRGWTRLGVILP